MDLQNVGEFHCTVCFELFGENLRCPKILSCGHSFCHSCLENLLFQSPSCPNCKQEIQFPNADCIPVNYCIKSLASRFNVDISGSINEQITGLSVGDSAFKNELSEEPEVNFSYKKKLCSKEFPYEGYCEDHQTYNRFRCMDCASWVCGDCIAFNHKPCRTLIVTDALKELKLKTSQEVDVEIDAQNSQNRILDNFLMDLEEKRLSLKKQIKKLQIDHKIESLKFYGKCIKKLLLIESNRNMQCIKFKAMDNSIGESFNKDQFTKSSNMLNKFLIQAQKFVEELTIPRQFHHYLSLESLRNWCQLGMVYASRCQNGTNQYGNVDVKGDRVWVHCFKSQRPKQNDVILSFRELLITFNGSTEFPKRGFIKIDDGSSSGSDVIIATDALTPRAMNFLLLCSGIKRWSYKGEHLENGFEWGIGASMFKEVVVGGISDGGVYEAPKKTGFVCGWEAEETNSLSGYYIRMKDEPKEKLSTKFGFVEEGIEVCERICCNNEIVYIKSCGLVI